MHCVAATHSLARSPPNPNLNPNPAFFHLSLPQSSFLSTVEHGGIEILVNTSHFWPSSRLQSGLEIKIAPNQKTPRAMLFLSLSLGRRPNGFPGLSLNVRTVIFLVILLGKTVSVG